jgi:hypothetical protein
MDETFRTRMILVSGREASRPYNMRLSFDSPIRGVSQPDDLSPIDDLQPILGQIWEANGETNQNLHNPGAGARGRAPLQYATFI